MATYPTTSSVVKSGCGGCPSFVKSDDTYDITGRNIGADVCLKKGKILSKFDGPPNLLQIQARNCDDHGKPIDGYDRDVSRGVPWMFPVAMPDIALESEEPVTPERVRDCNDCKAYVPAVTFRVKTGWSTGFCKIMGSAILEDRLAKYASNCSAKTYTPTRFDTRNQEAVNALSIRVFPEFDKNFGKLNAKQLIKGGRKLVDPADYPSDVEINPAWTEKLGIRALRKIKDPKGFGPDISIPVMRRDFFSPEIQATIPTTGDDEHPEDYVDHANLVYRIAVMWRALNETPALWGPPGVGKTELFRHLAWLMQIPFNRVSITEFSDIEELAGKTVFEKNETKFNYGSIPKGWISPNVLCLDEANTGPNAVWQYIRPLTDDSKQLVVSQNNGERLKRNQLCFFGLAMNPAWDARNVGANPLGDADGSRLIHVYMDLPPEEVERAIIARRLLHDKWDEKEVWPVVDMLMKISPGIRALSESGEMPVSWGLRQPVKVARLKKYMPWIDAFKAAVIDSLEPQQRQAVLDIVRQFTPEEEEVTT